MDRINKLKELITKSPGDNFLQHALALEYIKIGEDKSAQPLFEEILHRNPGYVGSYYHLAKLLARNGDREHAINWYERGMEEAKKAGDQHALNELRAAYEELMY